MRVQGSAPHFGSPPVSSTYSQEPVEDINDNDCGLLLHGLHSCVTLPLLTDCVNGHVRSLSSVEEWKMRRISYFHCRMHPKLTEQRRRNPGYKTPMRIFTSCVSRKMTEPLSQYLEYLHMDIPREVVSSTTDNDLVISSDPLIRTI